MSPSSSTSRPRSFRSKLDRAHSSDCEVRRFLASLKECSRSRDLDWGKQIHAEAECCGLDSNAFVASSLVNLYGKCGCMDEARRAFDRMNCPDLVAWNSLILGYAVNGHGGVALQLFLDMESRGLQGNSVTFIGLLKACASLTEKENGKVLEDLELVVKFSSLDRGMALHSLATARGIDTNALVASSLVEMYARCGSVVDAWKVFHGAPKRDVVLWTSLMQGFVENGQSEVVLELFVEMQRESGGANARTFVAVFQAITSLAKRERGEETIHGRILKLKSLERAA
ncbi:putative pentatricopeptide repeat-containing protein At3g23330 [Selaginella moellendorffii]|uniref:putative pentatricopeptide repeat-containing protein At3g23330 n=1 Tax=Selaginella moellendorffii TaxID=88036 RepID=UPI000D1CF535|nr:putative pentatricopeptide repeat-containing protein At3g23330 [Selaginella moellendorffii]|eukprot:XP_024527561.1 putative pentatricopeptide repeat-containing protein At3g23330 [Selaginella moellendorffii]